MKLLQVERTDSLYRSLNSGDSTTFCERLLAELRVELKVREEDLKRIPKSGAVVAVSNHPFGIVEGVALAQLLPGIRPDIKILANGLMGQLPEIADRVICVNPFGGADARRANAKGMRESLDWLESGGMLLVFPAGEVSQLQFQFPRLEVVDPAWSASIAKLLRKSKAAALPMYIDGRNSVLFQLAGLVHPRLRTALLPHELMNKQQRTIEMRCGVAIPAERIASLPSDEKIVEHLRWRTYLLGKRDRQRVKAVSGGRPIAAAGPRAAILNELPAQPLVEAGGFQVFCAKGTEVPAILREIGRLREETFRQAGEGTGNSIDTDSFDAYYHHLFLWNREKQEIAGAYRLGLAREIVAQRGVRGLYTHTLFDFQQEFIDRLGPAIELGRSFIHPSYQRSYQPLLMLWKGIGAFVLRNAPAHVLFGPVSVSADYARASRELMASVLSRQNGNPELCQMVKARQPLKPRSTTLAPGCNLEELGDLIAGIEADGKSIPVLLRQYLKLGGQLLGFNVDRKFGNCLDGLIVVDLARTDRRLLERYMNAEGARHFLSQYGEGGLRGGAGVSGAIDGAVERVALDGLTTRFPN